MAKKKKEGEDDASDDSTFVGCPAVSCSGGAVTDGNGNKSDCTVCGGWGEVPVKK